MAKAQALSNQVDNPSQNYERLVRFLLEPLLDSPESLCVDCEDFPTKSKVWLRLAFEQEDKGRIFGRGGRNLQAIKTILETSAAATGKSLYLDVYGGVSHSGGDRNAEPRSDSRNRGSRPSRPVKPRP